MELDDELCLCFHVTRRKVVNFLRVEKPKRAGQLAECFGAGTGCGWCRPFLQKLFDQAQAVKASSAPPQGTAATDILPGKDDYARNRAQYVQEGKGKPPAGSEP